MTSSVTQPSLAERTVRDSVAILQNDTPIASEMSNELVFDEPGGASGAFHSAHDFAINNSTFNNVQGNYNYYEAPKTGNGSPSLHQVLKPEFMDEYNRTPCLENTRRNVINDIMEWIADTSNDPRKVLWVYGLAGTGKSTLSTTIAQIMRRLNRLGAFYFFNRDIPQRNFATLIRTLAYQLAMFDTSFCAVISRVVATNERIAGMPLEFQFETLLSANALKSVEWSGRSIVLIIDALDECGSEADREILTQVLSKGFSDLPSFIRILIFSRQEQDIQHILGSHSHLRRYLLDIDSVANKDDVLEYLRHRLEEIRITNGRLGDHWPGEDKIRSLADRAGGLFIWASTACLYIKSYAPNRRLSELVKNQPEGHSSGPFARLNSLYTTGLHSAGPWHDPLFRSDCRNILGVILCARVPLSCSVIDALLKLPRDTSSWESVSRLGCVLHVSETEPIRILHPSFRDYLSERRRSQPWSINLEHHNKELALHCIELLDKELRENMCDMTLPYLSQKCTIPEAISYACKFWIEHICLVSDVTDDIVNQIYVFLRKHLLHWMEALAILKCHDHTIRSIDTLMQWLLKSSRSDTELYRLLYDGHRFAQYFANTIQVHPLLLYTTALPFTPTNTSIFRTFYHSGLPKVVCGVDQMWSPELIQLRGHDGPVNSVAFSPDGSKIISGSSDKTIRVWDSSTGIEVLPPLRGHGNWISSVAFSADGSKIISGSWDKTIRVWDSSTGIEVLPPLRGHDDRISSVTLSPDGFKIISGSDDRTIRVWDASTGIEMLPPLRGHEHRISSVAFSPHGSKIVSGSHDKTIRVWDASTGIELLPPLRGHDDWICSVAFSSDGAKIVSGSVDKTIRVWDSSAGVEMLPPLRGHAIWISSVAFSPDGSKIISGSFDKTIRFWDSRTGIEMLPALRGHDDRISSIAFSPYGSKIVSGSDDKTIRVWDANIGIEMFPPLRGHDDRISSVAFSANGSRIISGSHDKTIRVWDGSTGIEMLPPLRGHDSRILSVAFSPDESKIISESANMIQVWDSSTGIEMFPPLRGHDHRISCVAFSANGSKIISGSHDKTVRVWDSTTGVEILPPFLGHDSRILSVAFSPDESKIISKSAGMVQVWDASTGIKMLPLLRGFDGLATSVAFSPDGSKIILVPLDKTIRVWDATIGIEMLPPLRGHDSWISSIAFSSDGSKIISGSHDKTIRVWDSTTGMEMLRIHNSQLGSVAFSPDESYIISKSAHMIHVWDSNTGIKMLPPFRCRHHVSSVAFSPDGRKIISGFSDKTIRVWNSHTGMEIRRPLRGHDSPILSVAFSPDGSKIISESDGMIRVWDARTGILLPCPQIPADGAPRLAMDERMIGGWFTNINTGKYMGALPVGANFHSGKTCGSTYVGWTREYKLVLIHFPEQ